MRPPDGFKYLVVSEQRLASAGWVPHKALADGTAVMFLSSDYPKGYRHSANDDLKGTYVTTLEAEAALAAPTRKAAQPEPSGPKCTVDGVEVDELAVLVKPTAFLVTTEHGTHEITRCYFHGGKFKFGVDMERVGGVGARSVEYQPDRGLQVHLDYGYEMFIPMSHCQATWRLPQAKVDGSPVR